MPCRFPYQIPLVSKVPEVTYQVPRSGEKLIPDFSCFISEHDEAVPVQGEYFPTTEKMMHKNARIMAIFHCLNNPSELPTALKQPTELRRLCFEAAKFAIVNGKLVRRHHGKLLVVPDEHQRVEIVRQVHEFLGHRGTYTTVRNIKDRFWWPSLQT